MGNIISVRHVTKKYKEITAVNDVSFEVEPTSGELTLAGFDVIKEQAKARKVFGIVFQDPSLDGDLTAYENLQLHAVLYSLDKKKAVQRMEELLKLVELWDRKDSLVKTFSGGMKRRLEIARGLLHHPKILFLDEPTLGLDAQTRNLLWNYIEKLNKEEGMTIFFTTHYLGEAEAVAHRIAIIDHGKMAAFGTTEELRQQTGKDNLEKAYLELTGTAVRDETVSSADNKRDMIRRVMTNR
jgi:ABC-2 type transport system ATP-binding protein